MSKLGTSFYDHPIFTPQAFRVPTRAEKILLDQLHDHLWTGKPGAFFHGPPRIGKTTAFLNVRDSIQARSGVHLPALYTSMPPRDKNTIREVHYKCLTHTGLSFNRRATCNELANTLVAHLIELSHLTEHKTVILIVDEIQRLTPKQIEVFSELYDTLYEHNLRLCVFMVGNSSSSHLLLSDLELNCNESIRGRFFTEQHKFKGIHSKQDVEFILKQYDKLRYPEETGPTYTEFFSKKEFNNGFRLAQLSSIIWDTFNTYRKQLKISSWPAQYFFSALNLLLPDYLYKYGAKNFESDMISACIEASGLLHAPYQ
ncbi:MAG: ATP-binding protein [Kangiella sp.]|nr:ATP-binding protein [Kangiella sp.]